MGAIGAFLKSFDDSPLTEPKAFWSENYVANLSGSTLAELPVSKFLSEVPSLVASNQPSLNVTTGSEDIGNTIELTPDTQTTADEKNLPPLSPSAFADNLETDHFELDRVLGVSLELFTLLHSPKNYSPDTWDLTQDQEARGYWLSCLEVSPNGFVFLIFKIKWFGSVL